MSTIRKCFGVVTFLGLPVLLATLMIALPQWSRASTTGSDLSSAEMAALYTAINHDDVVAMQPAWQFVHRDPAVERRMSPLVCAALFGSHACAQKLVELNVDPNALSDFGVTPLMMAATQEDRTMIELLLRLGADPTLANANGHTALDDATETGNQEIIQILHDAIAARRSIACN